VNLQRHQVKPTFGVPGNRELVFLWAAGLGGLIISLVLFFTSAPGAHVAANLDQDEARDIAIEFLASQGVTGVESMSAIETLNTQSAHFLYLDDRYDDWEGIERGQETLAVGNWAFHWEDAGLFDPTGADEFWVTVDFNGQVAAYRHGGMEGEPEAHPEREAALDLARKAMLAAGIDPSAWELEDYSAHRNDDDDRTDSLLTWAALEGGEDTIPRKITITLHGNTLEQFRIKPGLPDRFNQLVEQHERQAALIRGLPRSVISFVLLLVLAAIFLRRYHQGELGVNRGATIMLVFLALYTLVTIGILPLIFASANVAVLNMAQSKLFMGVFMFVFLTLGGTLVVFVGYSVGESYTREGWAGVLQAVDGLFARRVFTRSFGWSVHTGFLCGATLLGVASLAHWLSYAVLGYRFPHGFNHWAASWPLLLLLVGPLATALFAESSIRLPFLAGGRSLFPRHPGRGLLLGSLASSLVYLFFCEFPAPDHMGLAMALFFILGLLLCGVMARYGFMASFWATFFGAVLVPLGPMFVSGPPSIRLISIFGLCALLVPVVMAAAAFRIRQPEEEHKDLLPAHIRRITERERMQKELEIARHVQMKLLPKESPRLPGYDVAGTCIPATEVGGDYFDFISLGRGKLGIAVGDVSGKGVSAAIYMTLTKGILQSHVGFNDSPVTVLSRVNSLIYRTIEKGIFISLFYAVLDSSTRELIYSRAGHNPGFLLKQDSDDFESLHPPGMALGLDEGELFSSIIEENTVSLSSGDVLVFYTDGITEAMNVRDEEYGEERLMKCISDNSHLPSKQMVDQITADVNHFAGTQPQHDDITLVVMRVLES
jgi:hypothetical protein